MLLKWVGAISAAVIGLAATAGSAAAQSPYDWSGFYIGFTTGWGFGNAGYTFHTDGAFNIAPGDTFDQRMSGMPIGGYVGYNFDTPGALVWGIEASVQSAFAWLDGEGDTGLSPEGTAFSRVHYWGTLGPRVGWSIGRALVFAEAGGAFGHIISELERSTSGGRAGYYDAALRFGYFLGIGVDYAFTDRLTVGFGVRHIGLGTAQMAGEMTVLADGLQTGLFTDHGLHTGFTSVLLRLGFNF